MFKNEVIIFINAKPCIQSIETGLWQNLCYLSSKMKKQPFENTAVIEIITEYDGDIHVCFVKNIEKYAKVD